VGRKAIAKPRIPSTIMLQMSKRTTSYLSLKLKAN
jgi:hypothetical protein